MPTLGTFRRVHPQYSHLRRTWQRARALYDSPLHCSERELEDVFPRHHGEEQDVYDERKSRAFYENYAGAIVDKITANVFEQTVRVVVAGEGDGERPDPPDPTFYEEFESDASRPSTAPGTESKSLQDFAREWLTEAQLTKLAWMQVCLPRVEDHEGAPAYEPPATLAQEDEEGTRRAYLMLQPAESVLNWRIDDDGRLVWLVHCREDDTRDAYDSDPNLRCVTFTVWDAYGWAEYEFEWNDKEQRFEELKDDMEPTDQRQGAHTFGGVPWVLLDLPKGLWTMGKIWSIAVELFNKHCALSWAEYRNLYPILASFLAGTETLNPATENPLRGQSQRMSPGYAPQFGNEDRLEFVSPDAAPYQFTLEHLRHLRDEMHRVVHQMAQSVDNSAAALQRSGESKQQDRAAESIVSNAFGARLRQGLVRIYALVCAGRADGEVEWEAEGLTDYDAEDTATMVAEAAEVEAVGIPSATFQRLYKGRLAMRLLGEDVSPKDAEAIMSELEGSITPESFEEVPPVQQHEDQMALEREKIAAKGEPEDEGSFA